MLKKFFVMTLFTLALMLSGTTTNQAYAGEVYVGTYSDGTSAYLLTHTVSVYSRRPYSFSCTVYSAGSNLNYNFFNNNGSPYYRNSWGYEGYVYGGQSPVAANIYQYVVNRW